MTHGMMKSPERENAIGDSTLSEYAERFKNLALQGKILNLRVA
jgi:hypothetical protein